MYKCSTFTCGEKKNTLYSSSRFSAVDFYTRQAHSRVLAYALLHTHINMSAWAQRFQGLPGMRRARYKNQTV